LAFFDVVHDIKPFNALPDILGDIRFACFDVVDDIKPPTGPTDRTAVPNTAISDPYCVSIATI
jgi:hypothetical protein